MRLLSGRLSCGRWPRRYDFDETRARTDKLGGTTFRGVTKKKLFRKTEEQEWKRAERRLKGYCIVKKIIFNGGT
jgi:hypothetical protein